MRARGSQTLPENTHDALLDLLGAGGEVVLQRGGEVVGVGIDVADVVREGADEVVAKFRPGGVAEEALEETCGWRCC